MKALKMKIGEFVLAILGIFSRKGVEKHLFCGFPGDPKTNEAWLAKTMKGTDLPDNIKKTNNNYVTLALFRPDPKGKYRAKNELIVAVIGFLLDDIGTKVKSKIPLPLSWKIETSPGNFQGVLLLDVPCTDIELYQKMVKAFGKKGWSDTGASGAARWVRLPYGVNGKEEYLVDDESPKVKLDEFHPERRYCIEQVDKAFGLGVVKTVKKSIVKDVDETLSALKSAGLWKKEIEPGKHDITCPWKNEHTKKIDHGTVYFEPSDENKNAGGFKCQHGHCSARGISDLHDHLGISAVESKAKTPLESALELFADIPLFHDENRNAHCVVQGSCLPITSKELRNYFAHAFYKSTGKPLNPKTQKEIGRAHV